MMVCLYAHSRDGTHMDQCLNSQVEASSAVRVEDTKALQVRRSLSHCDGRSSQPATYSIGGNETGLSSEQTYDRVESATHGSETRAARCKSGSFSHSGLSSPLIISH